MDLSSAVELNNRAVFHLQYEQPREAVSLLRSALTSMKDKFKPGEHCPTTTASTSNSNSESLLPTPLLLPKTEAKEDPLEQSVSHFNDSLSSLGSQIPDDFAFGSFSSLTSSEDDYIMMDMDDEDEPRAKPAIKSVAVLSDMLMMQQESIDSSFILMFGRALTLDDNESNRELITAVVMYNMALIHHSRGISRGRTSYLCKAVNLYKMGLHIIQKIDPSAESQVGLLLLAVFNNLAQIYSHFFRLDKLRIYLSNMRGILAEEGSPYAVGEDDYVWFFTNVMFYQGTELSIAPAA